MLLPIPALLPVHHWPTRLKPAPASHRVHRLSWCPLCRPRRQTAPLQALWWLSTPCLQAQPTQRLARRLAQTTSSSRLPSKHPPLLKQIVQQHRTALQPQMKLLIGGSRPLSGQPMLLPMSQPSQHRWAALQHRMQTMRPVKQTVNSSRQPSVLLHPGPARLAPALQQIMPIQLLSRLQISKCSLPAVLTHLLGPALCLSLRHQCQ